MSVVAQLALLLSAPDIALWLWPLFGFFGTAGIVTYAALSQRFPPALAGRVITGLNVLTFSTAFAAQWGIGAVINLWPAAPSGSYAPDGYRSAFAIMLVLQAAALTWFWIRTRRTAPTSRSGFVSMSSSTLPASSKVCFCRGWAMRKPVSVTLPVVGLTS